VTTDSFRRRAPANSFEPVDDTLEQVFDFTCGLP